MDLINKLRELEKKVKELEETVKKVSEAKQSRERTDTTGREL